MSPEMVSALGSMPPHVMITAILMAGVVAIMALGVAGVVVCYGLHVIMAIAKTTVPRIASFWRLARHIPWLLRVAAVGLAIMHRGPPC